MFEYVEMYRDIRYEALPPEFHELQKAREIMRPYWKVRDWAEKEYGKPQTEWQQRRLNQIISRIRKNLRRMNPQVEEAYNKFYTR